MNPSGRPPVAPPPRQQRDAGGIYNGRNLFLGNYLGILAPAPETLPPHVPPGFFTPNAFYQARNRINYKAHDFSNMGPVVNPEPPGYDPFTIAYENRPTFDPRLEDFIAGGYEPYEPLIQVADYNDMMPTDVVPPIAYQTERRGSGRLPANPDEEPAAPPFRFIPTPRAPPRLTGVRFHKPTPFARITRRRRSR